LVCTIAVFAVAPSFASASTTSDAYQHQASAALATGSADPGTNAQNGATTLPFTGLDIAVLVLGGGCLLGVGVMVRRMSARLE
jgi:hypothetical protein